MGEHAAAKVGDHRGGSAVAVSLLHPGQHGTPHHHRGEQTERAACGARLAAGDDVRDHVGQQQGLRDNEGAGAHPDAGSQGDVPTGGSNLAQQTWVERSHRAPRSGARTGTGQWPRGRGCC